MSLSVIFPLSIATLNTRIRTSLAKNKKIILALPLIVLICVGLFWRPPGSPLEIQLVLESRNATVFPASDIYVVNGRDVAHISELIDLMGSHGSLFYQSSMVGVNQGPEGLIARDDVVIIKINCQWSERGGTNTDVLKELIQAIVNHPDSGFIGEIVVADNGQGVGSMDWSNSNAENKSQSTQDVVNMFSSACNVSTYSWQDIKGTRVNEYSNGDMSSGYILNDTADPDTGIQVSYPKFETDYGTKISFKHGTWNGTGYERLKVINMPVLKSHRIFGVTASIKNYMGVESEKYVFGGGLANGHYTVGTGGMGTLMLETGLPTLNIIDAIWVNANPGQGPSTAYYQATRVDVLAAGVDPIALDYWAAKHVLIDAARSIEYEDISNLDPDNYVKGLGMTEAFGVWLNLTRDEMVRGGLDITNDENRMNVHVREDHSLSSTTTTTTDYSDSSTSTTTTAPGFEFTCVILSFIATMPLLLRKRGNK
jgi:hypothetical protein